MVTLEYLTTKLQITLSPYIKCSCLHSATVDYELLFILSTKAMMSSAHPDHFLGAFLIRHCERSQCTYEGTHRELKWVWKYFSTVCCAITLTIRPSRLFFLKTGMFFEYGSTVFSNQPQEFSQHYHLKSYFGSVEFVFLFIVPCP